MRSVMSTPVTSRRLRSSISGSGVHVHATDRLLAGARHPGVVVLSRGGTGGDALDELAHLVGLGGVDELLPEHLPPDLLGQVLECLLERDVRAALRETTLAVDQAQEARGVVRDGIQEGALALLLHLEPPPLRHLDPGDEDEGIGAAGDVGDGNGCPRERPEAPVRATELGLDLLGNATRGCRRDRSDGGRVVVLAQEVDEGAPDELVIAPAERLAKRAIRPDPGVVQVSITNRPASVEYDRDAGD